MQTVGRGWKLVAVSAKRVTDVVQGLPVVFGSHIKLQHFKSSKHVAAYEVSGGAYIVVVLAHSLSRQCNISICQRCRHCIIHNMDQSAWHFRMPAI